MLIIPPGGFAGFAQQTPAVQALLRKPATRSRTIRGRRPTTKKKKRVVRAKRKPTSRRRKVASRSRAKPARMVKGSAAAKRHMAKLRRMRK